jgi:hypothetical protein
MNLGPRWMTLAALAATLALPIACDGGSADPSKLTESGYAALGKSDWKSARSEFQKALAAMQTTDPRYLRAKMGEVEALVHLDAAKARDEFLATARGMSSRVGPKEYIAVASKLTSERKFMDAIGVLEAGLEAHSEDLKLKAVGDRIKEEATKAGDDKALEALRGLGYL